MTAVLNPAQSPSGPVLYRVQSNSSFTYRGMQIKNQIEKTIEICVRSLPQNRVEIFARVDSNGVNKVIGGEFSTNMRYIYIEKANVFVPNALKQEFFTTRIIGFELSPYHFFPEFEQSSAWQKSGLFLKIILPYKTDKV